MLSPKGKDLANGCLMQILEGLIYVLNESTECPESVSLVPCFHTKTFRVANSDKLRGSARHNR